MYSFKQTAISLAALVISISAYAAGPNLGQERTTTDIAAWDISISPSGEGLPTGSGTATEGEAVYKAQCESCHGAKGAGKPADALVGGTGSLSSDKAMKTVGSYWPYATTLFDYTRRAMPFNNPQSLSNDELYAVSAYILWLNGIIEQDTRLDANTLPKIQMPNQDGFISAWP